MSVSKGDNYVRGNTVLVPEYNPSKKIKDDKVKKLEKAKLEAQNRQRRQKTREKLLVLRMISFIFVIGVTLLLGYASTYKMEASLSSYKKQIINLKANNESLKLILAHSSNIKAVEETAVNNLHMVKSNPSDVIEVDLSKNNFKAPENKNNAPVGLLYKLKKLLF